MPTPAKTHGCTWNSITADDLDEIAGVIEAEEYLDDTTHHHDLRALTIALAEDPDGTGANGVVLRKPSGTLIAYAWNQTPPTGELDARVYLHGGCHPAWRHEGVHATLVDWQLERAVEWYLETPGVSDELELVMITSAGNHIFADLLPQRGFPPQRWYHALRRSLADPLQLAASDLTFVGYGSDWSEAVRTLYNQVASRPEDHLDASAWEWQLGSAGIRDDLSWVAVADGRAVGWVLNAVLDLAGERTGWTEYLGAAPHWRTKGLFPQLLAHSHESFRAMGLGTAGIGVETDSDQGARPYVELGYQLVDTMVWYVKHPSLDTIGAAHDQADGK